MCRKALDIHIEKLIIDAHFLGYQDGEDLEFQHGTCLLTPSDDRTAKIWNSSTESAF